MAVNGDHATQAGASPEEPEHIDFREMEDTRVVSPAGPYRAYYRTSPQYLAGRGVSRYNSALKHLIPVRKKGKDKEVIGVGSAGFFSYVTFTWISKYMFKAFKSGLTREDLPRGLPTDSCDYNSQRLELLWQEEVVTYGRKDADLSRAVWKFMRTRYFVSTTIFVVSLVWGFISPTIFMRKLLQYSENDDATAWEGVAWAIGLTVSEFMKTFFLAWSWAINYETAIRLQSACVTLLYKKILRLNKLGNHSVGQLINLFANDSQRVFDMALLSTTMIGGPLITIAGAIYVYWLLGPWALLGMTTFLLFFPIQYGISHLMGYLRGKTMKVTDLRVQLISEIVTYIKLIKVYAWEEYFAKKLNGVRSKERVLLQKTAYTQSIAVSMAPTVPIISAIVTFLSHVTAGNSLTASQAFSLLPILNNQMRIMCNNTRIAMANIIDGRLAFKRIQEVLVMEDPVPYMSRPIDKSQAIAIGGATFALEENNIFSKVESTKETNSEKTPLKVGDIGDRLNVLSDINIEVPKGHLVGICGVVGSGKSSLLLATLGQLRLLRGHVTRDGSCAYASQEAWILNATLRENILFGESFDAKRYYDAVYSCCLADDINMLPGGDNAEIGERGMNLSGGQKQRVALARAVYANKDIYLLDDPLSAVDAHVGAHIFDKCILTALKHKTVLLVTHQVQLLHRCDEVLLMKDGHVAERGTHTSLMATDLDYALMVNTRLAEDQQHNLSVTPGDGCSVTSEVKPLAGSDPGSLISKEEVASGSVTARTYASYVTAAGGSVVACLVFMTFLLNVGSTAFSSWWLAQWISDGSGNTSITVNNVTFISDNLNDNPSLILYQSVYLANIGVILCSSLIRGYIYTKSTVHASSSLHNQLFERILHAPMSFFDTTPVGRIQNLFSRDMDEVDARLPSTVESILQNILMASFAILFICLVFPWFMIPFVVFAFIYYFISKIFRVAVRDLKRLETIFRSPIYSFIGTTVQGLSTIHAFGKESEFIAKFMHMFDENSTCMYISCIATRWLAIRLDTIAVSVTAITATLIIVLHNQVEPALAGLALAYASHITGMFQYTVRLISETEMRFISVERFNTYLTNVRCEGMGGKHLKPAPDWPAKGRLSFEKVSLSYRPGLPQVLSNITFTIHAGEKVGIVGRTGSGKSSLIVALFRLVDLSSGSIHIDGVDIANVALDKLRSRLSVIPQDPVLFQGTIRSNLDPFASHSDEVLWSALCKTQLHDRVASIPAQLDAVIGCNADFFSVGERQLLCLARALLRDSKVLLLDEATAAVDPETEACVQRTIAQEFTDCTVLTIAHRLATVTSCDRILVMAHGQIWEFDSPTNLLANPSSEFSRMLSAAAAAGKKTN